MFIFLVVKYVYDFKKFYTTNKLLKHIQINHPELSDNLIISYSFLSKPSHISSQFSESLKELHLERSEKLINSLHINKIIPYKLKHKLISFACIILVIFVFSVTLPFQFKTSLNNTFLKKVPSDIADLKISPGNCEVGYGESLLLSLQIPYHLTVSYRPSLFIKVADERFQEVKNLAPSKSADGTLWSFKYDEIFANTRYFFKIGPVKTGEYEIRVIKPITFQEITIRYDYPSYTGLPQRVVKNEPNLDCYKGTVVSIAARTTQKIDSSEVVFLEPSVYTKSMNISGDGMTASVRFVVTKEKSYRFVLRDKDKKEFASSVYNINIVRDMEPKVDILSPTQDLVAASDDVVPVIYSYEDDFKVSAIKFVYKVGAIEKSIPVVLTGDRKKGIDEYNLRLVNIKAQPGDIISYYLIAVDEIGNEGFSKTYRIEVASYEKFHGEIMRELEKFSDDLLKLLSAQSAIYERYKDKPPPDWDELCLVQNEIYNNTTDVLNRLSETIKKMEEDPFFDGYLLNEYRGMRDTLNYLKDNPLSSARSHAQQKNLSALQESQKEAISILEKMVVLSEDVWKYQNLCDLESRFGNMEKKFDALLENFEQKTTTELLQDIEEISRIMEEIRKLLSEMPTILPEEFINSEALKDMNFASARDVVSGIKDALSKSDYTTAKKMMEFLKSELKKMRDALKRASENLAVKSAPSDISGRVSSAGQRINEILKKQQNLYDTTTKYEDIRQKKLFDLQEKLLKELAVKQKELSQKATALKNSISGKANTEYFDRSLPLMEKVYNEFSSGRVYHSQKFLEDIMSSFSELKARISSQIKEEKLKVEALNKVEELQNAQKNILSKLKTQPKIEFSQGEKNALEAISRRQLSLRDELKSVKSDLGQIMKETATISYETLNNLSLATKEMSLSSENLSLYETARSLENQKNVIDLLSNSSSQMEALSSSMSGMTFGQKPVPSLRTTVQSKGTAGIYGVKIQKVELPSIDDYKVPPELRQEILKALLEKYPQEYEKIIQKYYRKLIGQ